MLSNTNTLSDTVSLSIALTNVTSYPSTSAITLPLITDTIYLFILLLTLATL
nr:MAG TPA: hypothetical protein [Bacteriophage sp.]